MKAGYSLSPFASQTPTSPPKTFIAMGVLIGVSILVANSSHAKTDPETVIGMWLFDEGKGNLAEDSSGNDNDGELKGDTKWAAGKLGEALEFDGADDTVEIPMSDSMDLPEGPITVVCWFMPDIDNRAMITRGTSRSTAPNRNWDLFLRNQLVIWIGSAGADYLWSLEGATKLEMGTWHHVAGVWDGTTAKDGVKLYVNGKEDGTADASGTNLATDFTVNIGGKGSWAFDGVIDEVAVFKKALSEAEIQRIMNSGLEAASAVLSLDKLATTWANIKAQ
jgi:hypothetical protein